MLVAPSKQLRNRYEWLGLGIRFEGNLIASRFVGMCALHETVGFTSFPAGFNRSLFIGRGKPR